MQSQRYGSLVPQHLDLDRLADGAERRDAVGMLVIQLVFPRDQGQNFSWRPFVNVAARDAVGTRCHFNKSVDGFDILVESSLTVV